MCAKVTQPGLYYAPWSEDFRADTITSAPDVRWNNKKKQYERNLSHGSNSRAKWQGLQTEGRVKLADLTDDYKKSKTLDHASSNADYIDYSFSVDAENVVSFEKQGPADKIGHIRKLEYNSVTLVLRVTFTNNNNVVAYFRVPSVVAGELLYLAEADSVQISTRSYKYVHTLGVRFWDLVRIRGTLHGSRYSFAYTTDNGSDNLVGGVRGTGHSARYGADFAADGVRENEILTEDSIDDYFYEGAYMVRKDKNIMRPVKGYLFDDTNLMDAKTGNKIRLTEEQKIALGKVYVAGKKTIPEINAMLQRYIKQNSK